MSLRIVYTNRAAEELRTLRQHLNTAAGPTVAKAQVSRIKARIDLLRDFPESGIARDEFGDGRRGVFVAPWIVIFTVAGSTLLVVRVVHGARDLPSVLDD